MAYTKDYYSILGLNAPSPASSGPNSMAEIRRAYKLALLAAHPDKQSAVAPGQARGYTVDEVKEAYTILADQKSRVEYNDWILRNPNIMQRGQGQGLQAPSSDFVLGLELLDLSDFDVLDPNYSFSQPPSDTPSNPNTNTAEDGDAQMEWTRACRCGADRGFRILEEELEDAEVRGEKEVLVGCEGCSLWVRVGFEVEES